MLRDRFSDQIKVTFHIRQKPVCDSAGVDVDFGSESRDMWAVKHTEIHTHTTEQLTSVKTLRLRCFRFCYGGSKLVFVCYSYMLYAICLYVHIVFLAQLLFSSRRYVPVYVLLWYFTSSSFYISNIYAFFMALRNTRVGLCSCCCCC